MEQGEKDYGSRYWLRLAINGPQDVINREVRTVVALAAGEEIEWISPLATAYTEYQDQQFIDQLHITLPVVPLKDFWPKPSVQVDGRNGQKPQGTTDESAQISKKASRLMVRVRVEVSKAF